MQKKVSVIIPVYMVESYLRDCVNSVQEQSYTNLEILCIHDCGTDGSLKILRELAAEDDRIRILENEQNLGLAATRNRGMKAAIGDYLYFLDSDDRITPDAIEALVRVSEADRLDAVVFCAEFLFEEERLRESFASNPAVFKENYPDVVSGRDLYIRWMKAWDWMPSQPRYFYRRDFLVQNSIRFIDGMLHEDETFAFDVLIHAERMRVLDQKYFIRRFRADSIMTGGPTMRNVEGCYRILQHVTQWAKENPNPELREAIAFYRGKIAANASRKIRDGVASGGIASEELQPFVSIIIPVYQVAPYLEECLNSVIAQTLTNWELICVDDGSEDRSPDILRRYEKLDPRICCIYREKNEGQSVARNIGLQHARGKYVYMLDADDKIATCALEELTDRCEKHGLDLIGFENQQFADTPEFSERARQVLFTYESVEGIYTGQEAFCLCVEQDVLSTSVPTFLMRRELLQRTGLRFVEHIYHEDIGFILTLLLAAKRVELVHRPYFFRRFRANSTVTGPFDRRHMEGYLKSWQSLFEVRSILEETTAVDRTDKYRADKRKTMADGTAKQEGIEPETIACRSAGQERLLHALEKWKRDVLGRIRMLYTEADGYEYELPGGIAGTQTGELLEAVREMTPARARSEAVLGPEMCNRLEHAGRVYVCGSGQYAHRAIELIAGLDVVIAGVIPVPGTGMRTGAGVGGNRRSFCGFPILSRPVTDPIPTVLAVSHYNRPAAEACLRSLGLEDQVVEISF